MRPDHRRLSQCGNELVVDMVDLDRRETQPLDALDRACCSDQVGELHAGGAVAEAAEVDAGEDDLAVALRHPPPDLAEHGFGAPRRVAPRTSGITQNAQENEQPSWILTKARTRSSLASACTQPIAPTSPATVSTACSIWP